MTALGNLGCRDSCFDLRAVEVYKGLCFHSVTFSSVIGCIWLFVHEWTVCIYSTGAACFIVCTCCCTDSYDVYAQSQVNLALMYM